MILLGGRLLDGAPPPPGVEEAVLHAGLPVLGEGALGDAAGAGANVGHVFSLLRGPSPH